MPNARVPAAAGGLPSRRATLAGLAGLGAALSLPKTAHAASTADAALIAAAAHAQHLAEQDIAAMDHHCDAEERSDRGLPVDAAQLAHLDRLASEACHRFVAAVEQMTDIPATTIAGVAAKARVIAFACDHAGYGFGVTWIDECVMRIFAEVIMIGGAA